MLLVRVLIGRDFCSEFIEQCGLLKTNPLSELKGCRIGVDGHKWLATLGDPTGSGIDEPFVRRRCCVRHTSAHCCMWCLSLPSGAAHTRCPHSSPRASTSLSDHGGVPHWRSLTVASAGRAAGIRPLLVFNGLPMKRIDKPQIFKRHAENIANVGRALPSVLPHGAPAQAWIAKHRGEDDKAFTAFGKVLLSHCAHDPA